MNGDPHQILSSLADRIVNTVVDCLGDGEVLSIFVAGGFARGEIARFERPGFVEIYSDLDVYVILRRPQDLESARRRVAVRVAALPRETGTYRIFPEPDVGVYSEEDFLAQKTRPGTVEISDSHVVLHGSAETPREARRFAAAAIAPAEALYLIENRLAEMGELARLVGRGEPEGFERYVRYVILKSGIDAVAAALIGLGLFQSSRAARMEAFRAARSRGDLRGLFSEEAAALAEACYEGVVNLQRTLETNPSGPADLRRDVEAMLLGLWKASAVRLSPVESDDWSDLVEWRCKAGRWPGNVRELSALARRTSRSRFGVLRHSGGLGKLSPVDALRLSGTVEALLEQGEGEAAGTSLRREAIESGYLRVLDELTRAFGYESGPVFERARRMFQETA
jgi:predicted nucleotidyltransferase